MIEVIQEARNNLVEHTKDKADLSARNQMIQNLIGKINNELKKEQELIRNFQSASSNFSDVKINGSSEWSGMALGAGIQIKKLKIGASYAKYHTSSSSLLFNFAMTL